MIQGLQGGQDVLIVPHVVHKVIWGKGRQGSKVIGGSWPSLWVLPPIPSVPLIHCLSPGPSPPKKHTPPKPRSLHSQHLPHSSLVSTWLQRENERDSGTSLCRASRSPSLPGEHSLVQLAKHLPGLFSFHPMRWHRDPGFTDAGTAGEECRPLQRVPCLCVCLTPSPCFPTAFLSQSLPTTHQEQMGLNLGLAKGRGIAHGYYRLSTKLSRDALPRASLPAGSWALLGVWVALLALTLGLGSSCPSSEEAEHEKATHAGEGAGGSLGTQTRRGGVLAADAKGPELCAGPDNLPFLGPSSLTERRRPTECVSFIERLLGKGSANSVLEVPPIRITW